MLIASLAVWLVEVDVNYVVGGRSTDDDPLVWHLAGRLKSQSNTQGEKFMDRGSCFFFFFLEQFLAKKKRGRGSRWIGKVRFERKILYSKTCCDSPILRWEIESCRMQILRDDSELSVDVFKFDMA